MTTEEKLIALGFKKSAWFKEVCFKNYVIGKNIIHITFHIYDNVGTISNVRADYDKAVKDLKTLLKLDNFYEKQSKRSASRNASRNDSETQKDVQRA